jgi:isocitrate lyase
VNTNGKRAVGQAELLEREWATAERWHGIERSYTGEDVVRLRGTVQVEHTLARLGAERLWRLLHEDEYVADDRRAGRADGEGGPPGDLPLRLAGRGRREPLRLHVPRPEPLSREKRPALVGRLNNALLRADQIACAGDDESVDWLPPIVADAEAGFGGALNAFELMKSMVEAGAAGVHYEDQLSSEKKCGHLGGKVLVPTSHFVRTLNAARLAADVEGVPTILVARTDALSATLITSDVDPRDVEFLMGGRTPEGFFRVRDGLEAPIARSLAYAPYADVLWFETATPDLDDARKFAERIHDVFPGKLLAYNCSPSFNWRSQLSDDGIAAFQRELAAMGYRFQFITLAGFHALNASMFELASGYAREGMTAYSRLQQREFELEAEGYTATKHQREVGAGYFDRVASAVSNGESSTLALVGSTEEAQF